MKRRALLRAGVLLGTGAGAAGRTHAHPTPTQGAGTETPTVTPPSESPTQTAETGYTPLGMVELEGAKEAVVSDDGHIVYVAVSDGYAVVDITDPESPEVLSERRNLLPNRENGPIPQIYDVKHDGDTLVVVGPANGQQDPTLQGMLVVDVADPANPSRRAFDETDYPIHNCDLNDGVAYLTANGDPLRLELVDVTSDEPTSVGAWSLEEEDERWKEVNRGMRVVHDVYVQDEVAYVAHWDAGTWILDVSDPSAPSVISRVGDWTLEDLLERSEADDAGTERITLPGNSHYVAVDEAGDLMGVGKEAWGLEPDGEVGGIVLYDVSDPANPTELATIDPPPTPNARFSGVWTTSHNFEFREGILYSSWYNGGVKRHDVSDPGNPVELTWWADRTNAMFWTAQAAIPGEMFVGASMGRGRATAGLYVFPDEDGTNAIGFGDEETPTGTESPDDTASEDGPPPTTTDASESSSPGFGLLAGLAGVGAGALALCSRRTE